MSVTQFHWGVRHEPQPREWSNQELAEFYRISEIMAQAGLHVEIDQGKTDEGDPWLVFVRLETDDVIAHFARVDGFFVSVSSLTQDIYRGHDVRSVINQMLERHPLMVPRSGGRGRLFLHPSVVLTAFVAAAFVMAADDVRAQSLDDILTATLPPSHGEDAGSKILGKESELYPVNSVSGGGRAIFNGEAAVGHQTALLGAVMVAYSLMFNEVEKMNLSDVWSDSAQTKTPWYDLVPSVAHIEAQSREDNLLRNDDPSANIDAIFVRENSVQDDVDVSVWISVARDWLSYIAGVSEDETVEAAISPNIIVEVVSPVPAIPLEKRESEIALGLQNVTPVKDNSAGDGDESRQTTSQFATIVSIAQEAISSFSAWQTRDNNFDLGGIGVSVDSKGAIFAVGVLSGTVIVGPTISEVVEMTSSAGTDSNAAIFNGTQSEIKSSVSLLIQDPILENNFKPAIVGHYFQRGETETVSLSNNIDVVFYEGGNVEVIGFELGKDLLWLFVSPNEINSAKSEVINGSDLKMSFDGLGVLTFVDALSGYDAANLI
jgi:hypothetical protein